MIDDRHLPSIFTSPSGQLITGAVLGRIDWAGLVNFSVKSSFRALFSL